MNSAGLHPVLAQAQPLQPQPQPFPIPSSSTEKISTGSAIHSVSSTRYGFVHPTFVNPTPRIFVYLVPGIPSAIATTR